jgi:hypothetical protein
MPFSAVSTPCMMTCPEGYVVQLHDTETGNLLHQPEAEFFRLLICQDSVCLDE